MKRTNTVINITAILLFCAVLTYTGLYVLRSVRNDYQTAPAVNVTVSDGLYASGIIVRDETLITCRDTYVDLNIDDGQHISAGSVLAVSYSSDTALGRANRVRELELEIARIRTILNEQSAERDLTIRDTAARDALFELAAALGRGDLSDLDDLSLSLRSHVFDSGSDATHSRLSELEFELSGLQSSSTSDTKQILADAPGTFSSVLDGFEDLKADDIKGISPKELASLMKEERSASEKAIGKLVTSYSWYLASIMDENDAKKLSVGSTVSLQLQRNYVGTIPASVDNIGRPINGECTVIFSCSSALADTLPLRQVSAEIVLSEHTGLRVPLKALYTDEDGTNYVYTLTGIQAEKKPVSVIYEDEEFVLVTSEGDNALREGNDIIMSSQELYDGKIMN